MGDRDNYGCPSVRGFFALRVHFYHKIVLILFGLSAKEMLTLFKQLCQTATVLQCVFFNINQLISGTSLMGVQYHSNIVSKVEKEARNITMGFKTKNIYCMVSILEVVQ